MSPRSHDAISTMLAREATKAEVVGKIIHLRWSYHFGPHKIAMYLLRFHDIEIRPSAIWPILRPHEMRRLPSS